MVVEAQPVDHFIHRIMACLEATAVQPGDFERAPQALCHRVVSAVALAAHGAAHAVALQGVLELVAAVLAAAVAVQDQPRLGMPAEPRHEQCIEHQLGFHTRLHRPAHHLAAEQIDHDGQVQPAFVSGNVGDVAGPRAIGRRRLEVAPQQALGHRQAVVAVGGGLVLALGARLDAVLLHQLARALVAHTHTARQQLLPHARPAVLALGLGMPARMCTSNASLLMLRRGPSARAFSRRLRSWYPLGRTYKHLTGQRDRPVAAVALDPGVLHPRTLTKYAVAFSRMSHSIFTRASSARSRAISICSGSPARCPDLVAAPQYRP